MRYIIISPLQLIILAILIAVLAAFMVAINTWYMDSRHLPVVYLDKQGQCVKVDNYQNGHAFGCPDVNVLLRRYRVSQ
jgi:hypothetical protein